MKWPCALSAVENQISTFGFLTLLVSIALFSFFHTTMLRADRCVGGACAIPIGRFSIDGIRTLTRGQHDGHLV